MYRRLIYTTMLCAYIGISTLYMLNLHGKIAELTIRVNKLSDDTSSIIKHATRYIELDGYFKDYTFKSLEFLYEITTHRPNDQY